jgi:hypothetical protein
MQWNSLGDMFKTPVELVRNPVTFEDAPADKVERLKAVRRACPGMGLCLAKQLLFRHNWSVPFSIEYARSNFHGDWPVSIEALK